MTFWDFLWKCLEQHPRLFFAWAIASTMLVTHLAVSGLTINLSRDSILHVKCPNEKEPHEP